jgi:hypothetical protein
MAESESEHRRRVFAAPLREFTAVRDQLVGELRAKGMADEARSIANLRKPPLALWVANQLARLAPAEVKALIEATAHLRHAQTGAVHGTSADELREAMRAQRDALARLAEVAGRAALEAEAKLTLALQRRVQNTVQAAAASEPQALREGVLEKEMQPSGFEGLLGAALPARDATADRARKKEDAVRAQELQKAEREAQQLDARAKELEQRAVARAGEATRARQEADEARRKADEAAAHALKLAGR